MNGSHQAVYSLSQSEVALHCNAISHWLGYTQNDPCLSCSMADCNGMYVDVCHAAHLRQMSNKICFYGVHCMTKHLGHFCIEYSDSVDIWNRKVICMNSLMGHFIPCVYLKDQGISWFHVKTLMCCPPTTPPTPYKWWVQFLKSHWMGCSQLLFQLKWLTEMR